MRPLEGIKILDLSRIYAAPAGSMILADLGAEVIKVEHPSGSDSMRSLGPYVNSQSTYYLCANRNKKSITLDLKNHDDQKIFKSMVRDADIVIENFKTGDMKKMMLDYEVLKEINKGLIYCAVTGFGQTGPLADEPGFDPVIQAMSGLMDVTGEPCAQGVKVGVPIADILTSNYVVIAILSALRLRDITQEGRFMDISLLDVQLSSLANVSSAYLNSNYQSKRLGNRHNNVTPYQVFECSDGPLMICIGTDAQFVKFCEMIGLKNLAEDTRFRSNSLRKTHEEELIKIVEPIIVQKNRALWIDLLKMYKLPGGYVNTIEEALTQPQVQARDMIGSMEHPTYGKIKFIKNPLQHANLNISYDYAPPLLGQHNNEILNIQSNS